jgi:hypothetical protein
MNDDLKRMFEAMAALAEPPGQEEYDRRMDELYERHPNQWVLYREDWDDTFSELNLAVVGPFPTQAEAVGCWDALSPDEQTGYTLAFLEVLPAGRVRIGSPVVGCPPAVAPRTAVV